MKGHEWIYEASWDFKVIFFISVNYKQPSPVSAQVMNIQNKAVFPTVGSTSPSPIPFLQRVLERCEGEEKEVARWHQNQVKKKIKF